MATTPQQRSDHRPEDTDVVGDAKGSAPDTESPSYAAPRSRWLLELRDGAIVAAASAFITAWLFKIWNMPLRVPFVYERDGISQIMETKAILHNGWYQFNPQLGWPFGFDHHDFPVGTDNAHWLAIKALGLFSGDAVLVTNAYFLLSFVLVALTAFFVVRALGVSRRFSFAVALLYTFLPYHFLRGTAHLELAAYWSVPLSCLLTILVWRDVPPFFAARDGQVRFVWRSRRTLWLALLCVVIGSTGIYYAFFGLVLMGTVAVVRLVTERNWRPLAAAALLAVGIGAVLVVNLSPSLFYWQEHGRNDKVLHRTVAESDLYGLRPIQLVSPIPGHRISALSDLADSVLEAPDNSEASQFLGVFGSIGLVAVLVVLLARAPRGPTDRRRRLRELGALCAIAIFFGVSGGFEWVFGLAGFTDIRAWNRVSVFIGFYALLAVGILLDWIARRTRDFPRKTIVVSLVALAVVVVGVYDQTSVSIIPDTSVNAAEWNSDGVFVHEIEQQLGPGSSVFQLPYLPFPEAELETPPYGMVDYDPLRGYLHSDELNWSYAGMRGRESDWQAAVVKQPTTEMLDALAAVGFDGIWVDRLGYPNRAAEIEGELGQLLGSAPIVSPNQRFAFYDMRAYAEQVRARLGAAGTARLKRETLAART